MSSGGNNSNHAHEPAQAGEDADRGITDTVIDVEMMGSAPQPSQPASPADDTPPTVQMALTGKIAVDLVAVDMDVLEDMLRRVLREVIEDMMANARIVATQPE